ncbi:putative cytokine receptor family member b2 [Triplophysa rosa]|uniref:Cytokine receptor family member b2 n=2 Tax=Triplophysa rosa TaxID=992332 RepID=A0A9W7WTT9_TRIRA|nr:putative cytokine receptor family member b2 [Triplophysa rosa]
MTEIFIFISLIHTGLCMDIPAPVNLSISSEYLVHLLSWSLAPGTPAGVHYTVSMRSLSSSNVMLVKGCEKVTSPLQCNLTEAFSDPFETYYTSVSAVLRKRTSPPAHCSPFKPVVNSTLESPLVSVSVLNTSLRVSLRSPSPGLHGIYNSFSFIYRLAITIEDGPEFHQEVKGLRNLTVNDLTPGRRYCVNVSIINHKYSSRPAVCVSIPKTDNISVTDVLMALGLCLPMVLMVPIVMWVTPRFLSHFLFKKVDLPEVLKSFKNHHQVYRVLLIPSESISTLTEDTDALQKMKMNTDEHEETDGDAEEDGVMYERLATQHLPAPDTCWSSALVSESSPVKPSSGVHESSADVQSSGCSGSEGDGVSDSHHLLAETRALIKCVDEPNGAALEEEDVNLCSVMLHHDSTHDFELIADSFDTPVNMHMSDCEQESEEEYSEYLSRS